MMECHNDVMLYTEEFAYGWICVDINNFCRIAYGDSKQKALNNWDSIYLFKIGELI